MNISHDLCRPVGWAQGASMLIAADCSRHIGELFEPTTSEEREQIGDLIRQFWQVTDDDAIAPYAESLSARLIDLDRPDVRFLRVEGTAAAAPGLAVQAFPDLFNCGAPFVDKDGLVDYAHLLSRTTQVQPGVFHEPVRDVLLFAHPYFRRSLSHRNTLNTYVLRAFHDAASAAPGLTPRLRLDPDLLGHPESASWYVELEYWHGPKFRDDIDAIPSGVAEHKSDDSETYFSGVSRTQVWWKSAEVRPAANGVRHVRTFEVEELVEEPSVGLGGERFGCRYAHAEFDVELGAISHFDCAIRAYAGDAYLERIERQIDRAGKHADYTKLLRIDGPLPVPVWKRLLTDAYRGNGLIPEYLGGDADAAEPPDPTRSHLTGDPVVPPLMAQIAFAIVDGPPLPEGVRLVADEARRVGQHVPPLAEVGRGAIADLLRGWSDTLSEGTIECAGGIANLAAIELGGERLAEHWREVSGQVAAAIGQEAAAGALEHVSVAIRWARGRIGTTVSASGDAQKVSDFLVAAYGIVDPTQPAASWAEPLRDVLIGLAPTSNAAVDWPITAPGRGRLTVTRPGQIQGHLVASQALWDALEAARSTAVEAGEPSPKVSPARLGDEVATPLSIGGPRD